MISHITGTNRAEVSIAGRAGPPDPFWDTFLVVRFRTDHLFFFFSNLEFPIPSRKGGMDGGG